MDRLSPNDAGFILSLVNSPGWLRWIGDRQVRDLDAARQLLTEVYLPPYETHGFGYYAIRIAEATPVGICGFTQKPHLGKL